MVVYGMGVGWGGLGSVGYAMTLPFCFFRYSILLIFLFRCDNTKHHSPSPMNETPVTFPLH